MSVAREPRRGQNKFDVSITSSDGIIGSNGSSGGESGGFTNRGFEVDLDNNVDSQFKNNRDERDSGGYKYNGGESGSRQSQTPSPSSNIATYKPSNSNKYQSASSPRKTRSKFLPSIGLLLWKNTVLRRRHFIVTTLEIILPTLFACLIAYLKTWTPATPPVDNNIITNSTQFFEKDLVKDLKKWRCHGTCILAYAPENEYTNYIMKTLKDSIAKYRIPLKHEVKAFKDEEAIKEFNALQGLTFKDSEDSEKKSEVLRAAIVFEDGFGESEFSSAHKSSHLSYKIRIVDKKYNTEDVYSTVKYPGPDTKNAGKGYQEGGFAALQIFLDKAITSAVANQTLNYTMSVQGFPYPPYKVELDFSRIYINLLPQFLVFGFIFIVPSILRNVVAEKESGIKELMKMMSLRSYLHWVGWILDSLIILIIPVTIVVVVLFVEFSSETGAFLTRSDPTLWWVTIFLYVTAAVACLFFLSTFFQKATMAISVGIVIWIVTYFGALIPLERNYQWLTLSQKMSACLIPNLALHWAVKIMYSFEAKGLGMKWSNIGQPLSSLDDFTLAHVLVMLIISAIVFMTLTLYLEVILPSKYGISKPWYFIFQKSFWSPPKYNDATAKSNGVPMTAWPSRNGGGMNGDGGEVHKGFETEPMGLNPRVKIESLRKKFGKKVAVDGLSLNMYDGHITCLLGCNGAGKTTLISMLTGLFSPSSGTARVNNYDIRKDMDTIRTQLGYCSQYNILFEKLTVTENLEFFGRLKGVTPKETRREIKQLLEKLQLSDKKNALAQNLSGGQKRKLSLGMALIGGSKVVIMDEPTAGMDPEARRGIWDLLLEVRESRTMLLTTHFMEEADILGDRVAIISGGKVHCCGSPLFLKKHYGSGYTLKMSIKAPPQSQPDAIFKLVQKYAPDAYWKEKARPLNENEVCDISIVLPRQNGINDTSFFPSMFEELSSNKEDLGVLDIGLPLTTLDDVFAKVVEETSEEFSKDKKKKSLVEAKFQDSSNVETGNSYEEQRKITGFALARQHFYGLLVKRFIYTKRKKVLFAVQLILPLLLVLAAVAVFNKANAPLPPSPALKIDLNPYKNPKNVYATSNETEKIGQLYEQIIRQMPASINAEVWKTAPGQDLDSALLSVGIKDENQYRERYVAAADFTNPSHIRAMFQTLPYHASPLSINLASNAILRNVMDNTSFTLSVTNHPMKSGLNSLLEECTPNPIAAQVLPLIFALMIPLGLATLAASFIVFPLEERLSRAKQLQKMTGVSTLIFWMSSFLWDIFLVVILAAVMIAFFPILENDAAFTSYSAAPSFFLIIVIYGLAAISFSYLVSLFMSTVPGGFALVTVVHIFTGTILCILVHALEQSNFFDAADNFRWVGRLFPNFGASMSLIRYVDKIGKNVRCNMVTDTVKNIVCNPNITEFDSKVFVEDYQSCCDNCADFADRGVSCFVPNDFIVWVSSGDSDWIAANIELPGIGQELLAMFVMAVVYQIILYIFEYASSFKLSGSSENSRFPDNVKDSDVKEEANRVHDLVRKGDMSHDAIVVENLCKRFKAFAAVSNLSFGVHKGECFGLLGVNGAGKTTLFQMITGNLAPTSGNSYLGSYSLQRHTAKYVQSIGYCPQYDGVIDCLTGREMLELFCRLRGIQPKYISKEANKWLDRLGLGAAANVECQNYSGGMKRRLSAAISMIGRPPVIMLDEPTSGVDPVSRRQFWDLVTAGKDSGQALILTSHSMEECEALCSRLAIMVNGGLKCIGTVQHLKAKLSQGFTITMKMNQQMGVMEREQKARPLCEEIASSFTPCVLKENHENVIEYQVNNTEINWEAVFKVLEELKQKYADVLEDYSVSETTLEEIFLQTAKSKSNAERKAKVPTIYKVLPC